MNDAINRKDTIGAILSIRHIAELSDGDAVIRVSAVNYVLRNLPSAQPEIIHCEDCIHYMPYDWMFSEIWQSQNIEDYPQNEIGCEWVDHYVKPDDYCSLGERKNGEQDG